MASRFDAWNQAPDAIDPAAWSAQFAAALKQQQRARSVPQQRSQQKKVGKGGTLTSLISELSGAGGAAGGAATGAAIGSVVPGIGTVIGGVGGAIAGGFLGGTGGRVIENKVRDNRIGLGDALKEGTLTGALSGLGAGYQAAKGVKAARALSGVTKDVGVVPQIPARIGGLESAGRGMKASAMGFGQGARLNGGRIGAAGSDEVAATLKNLKIKAGSPEAVQRALENRITNLNNTLSAQFSKGNVAISKTEISGLKKTINNRIAEEVGSTGDKFAKDRLGILTGKKDTNALWEFNKNLKRHHTNFGANPDAKLVDREAVARIISDEVKNFQNVKLPGVAKTNSLYHQAKNADTLLKTAAADIKGGGFVGKLTTLSPVRAAESKVGSGLEKVGQLSAGTGGKVSKVTNQLKIQSPGSIGRAVSGGAPSGYGPDSQTASNLIDPNAGESPVDLASLYPGAPPPTSDVTGGQGEVQTAPESPYSLEQALSDIQRDPKNTDKYLSVYKTVSAAQKDAASAAGGAGPNVTKVTSQQYGLAQTGVQSLQQLSNLLRSDPSVLNRSATPGRKLPIVGGYISNRAGTGEFDAIGYNIADSLLRMRTGAAANKEEVRSLQSQLMPRAGDSQATVQRKLQQLNQAFSAVMSRANSGGGGGGSNLTDALAQLQGAY